MPTPRSRASSPRKTSAVAASAENIERRRLPTPRSPAVRDPQIPIVALAKRPRPPRGFLLGRLSNAGPRSRTTVRSGPASETLHLSGRYGKGRSGFDPPKRHPFRQSSASAGHRRQNFPRLFLGKNRSPCYLCPLAVLKPGRRRGVREEWRRGRIGLRRRSEKKEPRHAFGTCRLSQQMGKIFLFFSAITH